MPDTYGTAGLQIVDPVLSELAVQFRPEGFIYDRVTARMDVAEISGKYPIFDAAYFFAGDGDETPVADRAETPEVDLKWSTDSYFCEDYRRQTTISARERAIAHEALKLETSKVTHLLTVMAINRERRLQTQLRKTSNGGQLTLGGGVSVKWDQATATIEADIKAARKAIRDATGQLADTIVMDWNVAYEVALQEDIRQIIMQTGQERKAIELGDRLLPSVLHGLNVVIAGGMRNSANEGATASLSSIWSDNVVILKSGAGTSWGMPATIYSFRSQISGNAGIPGEPGFALVDRWETPDPPVEHIRAWECVDEKVVAPALGYEITDVLT